MLEVGTGRLVGICDDDPDVRRLLCDAVEAEGYRSVVAHTGREAVLRFGAGLDLAAIVLDIGLPDADGRDVLGALRSAGQRAPVLLLTARGRLHDRISGFAAGADDYLVKPFAVEELVARLTAISRREAVAARPPSALTLDPSRLTLSSASASRRLSPTEYRIVAALLARPGAVIRRAELRAVAWPLGAIVEDNTLDSFIRRVRSHLRELDASATITTVRGVGYALE